MSTESDSVAPKQARRKPEWRVFTVEDGEKMKSLYHYDAATGEFFWKVNAGSGIKAGDRADRSNGAGRVTLYCPPKGRVMAYRFAFFFMTGKWPSAACIDHIDGNPLNNQFQNLREATCRQNVWNRGATKTNTSGFKGVDYKPQCAPRRRWRARIRVFGKEHVIGYFETPEEAAAAYDTAAIRLHGDFAKLNMAPLIMTCSENPLNFQSPKLKKPKNPKLGFTFKPRSTNECGFKGISLDPNAKLTKRWRARINSITLGRFKTREEASEAYAEAARRIYKLDE